MTTLAPITFNLRDVLDTRRAFPVRMSRKAMGRIPLGGVYVIQDESGVAYVGQTAYRPQERLRMHFNDKKGSPLFAELRRPDFVAVATLLWFPVPDKGERLHAERKMIAELNPRLQRKGQV